MKRVLSLLLVLSMVLSVMPAVFAAETEFSGSCGENVSWSLDAATGVLTIEGEGAMAAYTAETSPFSGNEAITKVEIGAGITSISSAAFQACPNVACFQVAEENEYYCHDEAGVIYDKTMTSIVRAPVALTGSYTVPGTVRDTVDAFVGCAKLSELILEEGVKYITWLDGCNQLSSVVLPSTFKQFEEGALWNCTADIKFTVSEDNSMFLHDEDGSLYISNRGNIYLYRATGVKEGKYTIGSDVTVVEYKAFYGCSALEQITVPANVTLIHSGAFLNCAKLDTVIFEGDAPKFNESAFQDITATAWYPENNETWTASVLQNYGGTITWTKGDGICTAHQWGAWAVVKDADYTEEGERMRKCALCGEEERETIPLLSYTGNCGANLIWNFTPDDATLKISGSGAMEDYAPSKAPWEAYAKQIAAVEMEDGITYIGSNAFYRCRNLTKVSIPTSVSGLGTGVFAECNTLKTVNLPEGLSAVPDNTFYCCRGLTEVGIPDSVASIGSLAFADCDDLVTVAIPDSVTTIGISAFQNCTAMTAITIPEGVTSLDSAFIGCSSLESVIIPASVTSLSDFELCTGLKTVTFAGDCPKISGFSFMGASAIAYYPADNMSYATLPNCAGIKEWRAIGSDGSGDVGNGGIIHNPFTDVQENAFYYDAVLWAVEKGITTGKTDTTFQPDAACTRAQIVTFLWRAHGSPEPAMTENPFTDVKESAYYYKAVLWAVENKITTGKTDTSFEPGTTCTRSQAVTFIWRANGKPAPVTTENTFPDVHSSAYYYDAVLWAVENGITNGFKDGTFGPTKTCNRGQIVTFLYRDMA